MERGLRRIHQYDRPGGKPRWFSGTTVVGNGRSGSLTLRHREYSGWTSGLIQVRRNCRRFEGAVSDEENTQLVNELAAAGGGEEQRQGRQSEALPLSAGAAALLSRSPLCLLRSRTAGHRGARAGDCRRRVRRSPGRGSAAARRISPTTRIPPGSDGQEAANSAATEASISPRRRRIASDIPQRGEHLAQQQMPATASAAGARRGGATSGKVAEQPTDVAVVPRNLLNQVDLAEDT